MGDGRMGASWRLVDAPRAVCLWQRLVVTIVTRGRRIAAPPCARCLARPTTLSRVLPTTAGASRGQFGPLPRCRSSHAVRQRPVFP